MSLDDVMMSKIAEVSILETPTPLASANVGNGDTPSPPKTCRRLKWMFPRYIFGVSRKIQVATLIRVGMEAKKINY